MKSQTANNMTFVLCSTNELASSDGAGFWSNDVGWVEYRFATRFTLDSVQSCNLPISAEQGAKWIMWQGENAA
jgi:hypothetical protein